MDILHQYKHDFNKVRAAKRITENIEKLVRTPNAEAELRKASLNDSESSMSDEDFPNMKISRLKKKLAKCHSLNEKLDKYDRMSKTFWKLSSMRRDFRGVPADDRPSLMITEDHTSAD